MGAMAGFHLLVHISSLDGRKTKSLDRRVDQAEEQLSKEHDQLESAGLHNTMRGFCAA